MIVLPKSLRFLAAIAMIVASSCVLGAATNESTASPEVDEAGRVIFRLYAPDARAVRVEGEFPAGEALPLARTAAGWWSGRTTAALAGTYRYTFVVDGVTMTDPQNVDVSPTRSTVMSLVHVDSPATALEDALPVPHGAVARLHYPSSTLGIDRQMHVYTPPGYEKGDASYPVLYLLHGNGDADASWSTIGRAGFILDNLIARHRAKPMIVVMPAGHVPATAAAPGNRTALALFGDDLRNDIIPYIEEHYRVIREPAGRALAGLSMGGNQAANVGLSHSHDFPYLGIFSSGMSAQAREQFDGEKAADLETAASRLKLLWVGYGDTDSARDNAVAMLQLFDRHHLAYLSRETPGAHAWTTWRQHLEEFVPLLFQ